MAKKISRRQQRMSKYVFKPSEPMQTFNFMCGVEGLKSWNKMWQELFDKLPGKIKPDTKLNKL